MLSSTFILVYFYAVLQFFIFFRQCERIEFGSKQATWFLLRQLAKWEFFQVLYDLLINGAQLDRNCQFIDQTPLSVQESFSLMNLIIEDFYGD